MSIVRSALLVLLAFGALLLGGCASLQGREPIEVTVVSVEPLEGEGLELRMLIKLRIQNPNDSPLDFNGVSVAMDVQGKRFATGVSDAGGNIPRFGETVIAVPMSISAFRIAGHAMGIVRQIMGGGPSEYRGKLAYTMTGKLAGPTFNGGHFKSTGEFTLPAEIF
jgi:LEA14-like dessication related protein